jgi:TRAP-type C4-dicarboxylate transport system substrate-binding protein
MSIQVMHKGVAIIVNMDEATFNKLPKVAQTAILDQLHANVEALAAAKKAKEKALSCKVSEKKGVSVYGLGRFPVSLYANQWTRLVEFAPSILAFIEEHKASLSFEKKEEPKTGEAVVKAVA